MPKLVILFSADALFHASVSGGFPFKNILKLLGKTTFTHDIIQEWRGADLTLWEL